MGENYNPATVRPGYIMAETRVLNSLTILASGFWILTGELFRLVIKAFLYSRG